MSGKYFPVKRRKAQGASLTLSLYANSLAEYYWWPGFWVLNILTIFNLTPSHLSWAGKRPCFRKVPRCSVIRRKKIAEGSSGAWFYPVSASWICISVISRKKFEAVGTFQAARRVRQQLRWSLSSKVLWGYLERHIRSPILPIRSSHKGLVMSEASLSPSIFYLSNNQSRRSTYQRYKTFTMRELSARALHWVE